MKSIEQEVRKYLGESKLPQNLAERVDSKWNRLHQLYGINYDSTVFALKACPSLYSQSKEIPSLARFFGRHVDIWIAESGGNEIIFCKKGNEWIIAARQPYKIGLTNPYSGRIESWARVDSESKRRNDHFKNGGNPRKSRFNGNLNFIRSIEFTAFNKGIGVLESNDTMKMYLGFQKPIGISRKDQNQSFVCVECTRIPRRQQTKAKIISKVYGYKVRIHGYPVGRKDIEDNFRGLGIGIGRVPVIENP